MRLLTRKRPMPCGHEVTRADWEQGFCAACGAFTALCQAGRVLVIKPSFAPLNSDWFRACPARGTVPWEVTRGAGRKRVVFCARHDTHLRYPADVTLRWRDSSETVRTIPLAEAPPAAEEPAWPMTHPS